MTIARFSLLAFSPGLVGVLMLASCEPCFGVAECRGDGTPSVEGRLLTPESGGAVAGATITLIRSAPGVRDTATTTTDETGMFTLNIDAVSIPGEKLSLRVKAPQFGGYLVDSLPCTYSRRRGDGCVLAPIMSMPRLPIYQLYSRVTGGPAGNVTVSFRRTGGQALVGADASDSVRTVTTQDGFFELFRPGVFASSMDPIIGDLIVDLPAPTGRTIRTSFPVRPIYRFTSTSNSERLGLIAAGPTLNYWAVFYDSATNARLKDVEVEFTRTGGIPTRTDTLRRKSDENGIVNFLPAPLTSGSVTGMVRIRARSTAAVVETGTIEATTFDADSAIVLARWLVGPSGKVYPLPRDGRP